MTAAWTEFYHGRVLSQGYRDYCAERYAPYLHEIVSRIKSGDRVVEIGCGLGTMTMLIADNSARPFCGFRCFDVSPDMVNLAKLNLNDRCPVDVADALLPLGCYPDIMHSHGMLEHFCDADIWKVLDACAASGARSLTAYVPGDKYEQPSFGDERLLPLSYWQNQFQPTHAFAFNGGYDYCLTWAL